MQVSRGKLKKDIQNKNPPSLRCGDQRALSQQERIYIQEENEKARTRCTIVFQLTSIAGGRGGTIWLHSCVVGVVVGRCPVASGGGDGRGSSCQRRWHRFKGLAVRADWDVVYFAYHFRHLRHLRNTKRQTNNVSTRRKRPSSSTVKTGKKLASHGATLVPLDRPRGN